MAQFIPAPVTFSTIPSYNSPWFLNGFEFSMNTSPNNTVFALAPGMVRALTSDAIIRSSSSLLCDVSTVGPGGCYPYLPLDIPIGYNSTYPVYICWDKTNTVVTENPTLITATGNEFLPDGYNEYARVNLCYINGLSGGNVNGVPGTLYPWIQSGSGSDKEIALIVPILVVAPGSATTPTLITLSEGNKIMPPRAGLKGIFSTRFQAASPGNGLFLSYDGSGLTNQTNALQVSPASTGQNGITFPMICGLGINTAAIYYYVTAGATVQINNIGYVDSIGNRLY